MRGSVRAFVSLTIVATITACTGSATMPRVTMNRATSGAVRAAVTRRIGGVIDTTSFTVAAGETVDITSDLIVFASDSVKISGQLYVLGDHDFAFFTPRFVIESNGRILESLHGFEPRSGTYVVSACDFSMAPRTLVSIEPGGSLELTANYRSKGGTHCISSLTKAFIDLQKADDGERGTLYVDGQDGGSLEIGTLKAIGDADEIARKHRHGHLKASAPDVLFLDDAALFAGDGGNGAADAAGVSGGTLFSPGNGGSGGNVDIAVARVTGLHGRITAGSGGSGGTIGGPTTGYKTPLNGTAASPGASSVTIALGAGGSGGSVSVSASRVPPGIVEVAGNGGNPSLVTSSSYYQQFWAGDGYSPNSTAQLTSGKGGDVTLQLALPGEGGGTDRNRSGSNGRFSPMRFAGGEGGNPPFEGFFNFPGLPIGQTIRGGDGANLTIVPPAGAPLADIVGKYGLKVYLINFGNGGGSTMNVGTNYAACPSPVPSPAPTGINGANGGTLHDNGLWPLMYPAGTPVTNWGNGMNPGGGSVGYPGGFTGNNGYDDEGQPIGQQALLQNQICH